MSRLAREGRSEDPRKVKCRVLDGFCSSKGDKYAGDLVELSEEEATQAIALGRVELVQPGGEA